MGLRIGDTISTISVRPPQRDNRDRDEVDVRSGERADRRPVPQVGFGDNTTSPLSAAYDTIARTVRNAADIVPSLEEFRQDFRGRFQSRVGEHRPDTEEILNAAGSREALPEPQRVRPEGSPQVRNFEQATVPPREEDQGNRREVEQTRATRANGGGRLDVLA